MEYWFTIILAAIAICAIGILIYLEVMGDEAVFLKKKHTRGKFVNDQTAVVCQTIKETIDSNVAYNVFIEYVFTNHKQFLKHVRDSLVEISKSYNSNDIISLQRAIEDTKEMKRELKDQLAAKVECLSTIDREEYIETASWINLAIDCRFSINASLRRIAEVCIIYSSEYAEPFPDVYTEQLESLVDDICGCCDSCIELINSGDIPEMRELRKSMSVMLDESYTNSSRLYNLIHDGRSQLDQEKQITLKFVLNAFKELHGIIYTLRRFLLADICLTLSIK